MNRQVRRAGFTLIELLAVIAIIAILAGIVFAVSGAATRKAAIGRAEGQLKRMELGLEEYKAEYGVYPQTDETDELIKMMYLDPAQNGKKVFVEFQDGELMGGDTWVDAWGVEFLYDATSADRHNPDGYDLMSMGPDGKTGPPGSSLAEDDLDNW